MGKYCRACREDVAHCHGTLIRHVLHRTECTEDGCTDVAAVLHVFVIDCETVGCRCAEPHALAG